MPLSSPRSIDEVVRDTGNREKQLENITDDYRRFGQEMAELRECVKVLRARQDPTGSEISSRH